MSDQLVEEILPLSPLQEGLLFHALYDTAGPDVYMVQLVFELKGNVDTRRLQTAVWGLMRRHANLRAGFVHEAMNQPVQVIAREVPLPWEEVDLLGPARSEALKGWLERDRERRFDFTKPPLLRFTLIRLGEGEYRLVLTHHHILMDGWSLPVLSGELLEYYERGEAAALPRMTPYREYLRWIARQDKEAARQAWGEALRGLEEGTKLAHGGTRPGGGVLQRIRKELSAELTGKLTKRARERGLTLNTIVQGAWGVVLGRLSGREDVVFGITVSGRPAEIPQVERMVGLFINTIPLRMQVRAEDRLSDVLRELQERQAQLLPHQYLSLTEIQRIAGVSELFDTLLVFENYPVDPQARRDEISGMKIAYTGGHSAMHYPISPMVVPGERLRIHLDYWPERIDRQSIEGIAERLVHMLEAVAEDPEQQIGRIDLLSEEQRRQIVRQSSGVVGKIPPATVPELFERQVERTPDAVAVVYEDRHLTYAELNAQANQLAHALTDRGIGPETAVGIFTKRGPDAIASLLGVAKTGAAFLPLAHDAPTARLKFMIADLPVTAIVTDDQMADRLPATPYAQIVLLGTDTADFASERARNPETRPDLNNAAYVIYTSGSTGVPKGVVVPHMGISSMLATQSSHAIITPEARVLQFASSSFDASVWEILMAAAFGACSVIIDDQDRAGRPLQDFLAQQAITHATLPPSVLATLDPQPDLALETLVLAGEACSAALADKWSLRVRVLNAYGPTESTVCATISDPLPRLGSSTPPIGRPICNTSVYILDRNLEPMPVGMSGELYISGPGLARGYLKRPALTAERFVADPNWAGARMYRTGDIARVSSDGNLEFIGRADHQIKMRGFRIEPGEVESTLRSHPGVRDAVVTVQGDADTRRIVAYAVAAESSPGAEEIQSWLQERLPEHMMPAAVVLLDSLPLTASGKIDRKSLSETAAIAPVEAAVPQTPEEEVLCGLFAEVLGTKHVGPDDDFFELGGHSLVAIRLVGRIAATFGIDIPIRTVFELHTVRELAAHISIADYKDHAFDRILPLRKRGTLPPLFCLPPGNGLGWGYAGLLRQIDPEQPLYALQFPEIQSAGGFPRTLEATADLFISLMKDMQPNGPYLLLGWSMGGRLAHIVACRLQSENQPVQALIVLDTYPENSSVALSNGTPARPGSSPPPETPLPPPAGSAEAIRFARLSYYAEHFRGARFRPEQFLGDMLLFSTPEFASRGDSWKPYISGRVIQHVIETEHELLTQPGPIDDLGGIVREYLDRLRPA